MRTALLCLICLSLAFAIIRFDIEDLRRPTALSNAINQSSQTGRIESTINQGAFEPIPNRAGGRHRG
jgi:hypothetical protein